jgi:hypothetical protein
LTPCGQARRTTPTMAPPSATTLIVDRSLLGGRGQSTQTPYPSSTESSC